MNYILEQHEFRAYTTVWLERFHTGRLHYYHCPHCRTPVFQYKGDVHSENPAYYESYTPIIMHCSNNRCRKRFNFLIIDVGNAIGSETVSIWLPYNESEDYKPYYCSTCRMLVAEYKHNRLRTAQGLLPRKIPTIIPCGNVNCGRRYHFMGVAYTQTG